MANTIYYGKPVKEKILTEVKDTIRTTGRVPKNVVVQIGDNPASNVYVGNKLNASVFAGINMEHIKFPTDINTVQLIQFIKGLNEDNSVDGIFVQLPLPKHIPERAIANAIKPSKDVDGFGNYSQGATLTGEHTSHLPCTPKGIFALLDYYGETLEGKDVVIIGRSNIVGKPLAMMMTNAGATVTLCHSKTVGIKTKANLADIVVLATGQLKQFDSSYFRNGQLIIDVGIGRDENGKLCGDLDFEEVNANLDNLRIVPSPGGCGQTTVAALMQNILDARERKH